MNIGTHLREARERRGMTLHQLADSTKLSMTALQYIERNEFSRLPGGIFTRSYLRAYAAEVGADPEEVVHAYLVQVPAGTAQEPPSLPGRAIENARGICGANTPFRGSCHWEDHTTLFMSPFERLLVRHEMIVATPATGRIPAPLTVQDTRDV